MDEYGHFEHFGPFEDNPQFNDDGRLYRGGGKYPTYRTADELRAGVGEFGPHPGEVAEVDRVRVRVAIALAEIAERDAYLDNIKRQIEWMLSWLFPSPNFCNIAHLSAYLTDPSLLRTDLTYEEDLWSEPEEDDDKIEPSPDPFAQIDGDDIDANDCGPSF